MSDSENRQDNGDLTIFSLDDILSDENDSAQEDSADNPFNEHTDPERARIGGRERRSSAPQEGNSDEGETEQISFGDMRSSGQFYQGSGRNVRRGPAREPSLRRTLRSANSDSDNLAGTVSDSSEKKGKRKNRSFKGDIPAEEVQGARRGLLSGKRGVYIQIGLLVLIVLLLASAVIIFQVWNRGVDADPSKADTSKYLVEVNDSMVLLPDSKLKGHEDDGKTTILCLGNSPFSDETGDNGLAARIASLGNVTTINASFPNSQVTCENAKYDPSTQKGMDDIFNLFYVAYAIAINDYSSLETVASTHTDDPQYEAAVKALESTDFSKVDMIAIMYDATDYENKEPVVNLGNEDELQTYVGSLRNAFDQIQEKYPYIRIVFMSPTYMQLDNDGKTEDGRVTDLGNGTLIQYWQYAYDTCGDKSVSFLDNYYGSVNDSNYKKYLSDNIHLNDKGRQKIADHFVYKVVQNNYGEYDANKLMVTK